MPYLPSQKCVFVHVSKTGGTSITHILKTRAPPAPTGKEEDRITFLGTGEQGVLDVQHITAAEIRERIGHETYSQCYKFAVVRDPWDRLFSEYIWRVKHGFPRGGAQSFPDFIRKVCAEGVTSFHIEHFTTQAAMLTDPETGELIVDTVLKFESLDADWANVAEQLSWLKQGDGSFPKLEHLNPSTGGMDFRQAYDETTAALVEAKYGEDARRFGYTSPVPSTRSS